MAGGRTLRGVWLTVGVVGLTVGLLAYALRDVPGPSVPPGRAATSTNPDDWPAGCVVASIRPRRDGDRPPAYHRRDCPHVRRIAPSNLWLYDHPQQARQAGCVPCRTCQVAAD